MTLFIGIMMIVAVIIAIVYLSERNAHKSYEQIQKETANVVDPFDNLMAEVERMKPLTEAMIQADLVGDHLTSDQINRGEYHGPLPQQRSDGGWLSIYDNLRILKIAGINHRQGINRYVGRVECALVPEPDNEYDSDAIKVVAEDRHHLGYIPMGYTDLVCSFSANEFPYRCTAFIQEDEDELDGHKFYTGFIYIKRLT